MKNVEYTVIFIYNNKRKDSINFICRYVRYGNDNGIIVTFSMVSMLIAFGAFVFMGSDYLIKIFNPLNRKRY